MSEHVRARTDSGNAGWWCDLHEIFTGQRGWCPQCDGNPYAGTPLAGWADALRQADEAMGETLVAVSIEAIKAVLAEHIEARWSDQTSGCRGCAERYEEQVAPFINAEYQELSHPRWTPDEYRTHVAEALALALGDVA